MAQVTSLKDVQAHLRPTNAKTTLDDYIKSVPESVRAARLTNTALFKNGPPRSGRPTDLYSSRRNTITVLLWCRKTRSIGSNPEWNRKAAAFVSYGSAMGARGVQQLRETAIELQMAPIRSSVHIPVAPLWAHFQGGDVEKGLADLEKQANVMIDDLLWWTAALKAAREG
jgi:hypothetical protein